MNPVQLRLPKDAVVIYNALYPTTQPSYLTADLFAARLPGGVIIDAGWSPECDPHGTYEVFTYRGAFENQIEPEFASTDLQAVVSQIERLATKHSGTINVTSSVWPAQEDVTTSRHGPEKV